MDEVIHSYREAIKRNIPDQVREIITLKLDTIKKFEEGSIRWVMTLLSIIIIPVPGTTANCGYLGTVNPYGRRSTMVILLY